MKLNVLSPRDISSPSSTVMKDFSGIRRRSISIPFALGVEMSFVEGYF